MLLVPKEKSGEIWWRLSRIINNFEYNNVYNLLVISQVQDRLRNFIYRYIIPCISPMTTPRSRNYYPYFTHKEIQRECLWNSLRLYLVKGKEQAIAISLTVSLLIESQGWISKLTTVQFSSVQSLSYVWLFATPLLQHSRPPCPSPTPGVYPNSCLLSRWCHPTISFSVIPFSSCLQFFPELESFQMSQLFASGGQRIGVLASTSVLPMNTQDWSPLGWTSWIFLQSKGLSRVFSNTTVQKHQFLGAQLSL